MSHWITCDWWRLYLLCGFPTSVQGDRTCACRYGQGHLRPKREPADGGANVEAGNWLRTLDCTRQGEEEESLEPTLMVADGNICLEDVVVQYCRMYIYMRLNDLYNEEIDEYFLLLLYLAMPINQVLLFFSLQRVILEKVTVLQCST